MSDNVSWEGEPLLYRRTRGIGMVLGAHHYLFAADGRLERLSGVNAKVLELLVRQMCKDTGKDPVTMLAAYVVSPERKRAQVRAVAASKSGKKL